MNVSMMRDSILLKKPDIPLNIIENLIYKESLKECYERIKEIEETHIPENLTNLLKAERKNDQLKLLKNLSITSIQLTAFAFKAWSEYGFTYSRYKSERLPIGLDSTKMPMLVEIENGTVNKVGKTSLTDGQLKQAVDHRKVIVAKFFDKKDTWHCLFLTFDSLKGKEPWKDGQAHYHYISDKFGIPRKIVVDQLKSGKYHFGSLPHVDLIGYRDNDK